MNNNNSTHFTANVLEFRVDLVTWYTVATNYENNMVSIALIRSSIQTSIQTLLTCVVQEFP